mmetsp:Transcript_38873/g.99394  ORF Transcript_38873/g.99394 Transcript_38873/m.99394 type:complete len:186 (-) Transcript_38873:64-621(-)
MACYYGCSTNSSRLAWCLYLVFFVAMAGAHCTALPAIVYPRQAVSFGEAVLSQAAWILHCFPGTGCWIAFGLGFTRCVSEITEGPCETIKDIQLEPTQSFDNSNIQSVNDVAVEVCTYDYNLTATSPAYDDCVTCLTDVSNCVLDQRWTALAALILGLLSLGPCFFCCCCASPKRYQYASTSAYR